MTNDDDDLTRPLGAVPSSPGEHGEAVPATPDAETSRIPTEPPTAPGPPPAPTTRLPQSPPGAPYGQQPGPHGHQPPVDPYGRPPGAPYGQQPHGQAWGAQQNPYGQPPPYRPVPAYGQPPHPGQPLPYGQPRPAQTSHSSAVVSLVLALLALPGGLLFLAPFAWWLGSKAVREIDADPARWGGRDIATGGKVIGIIGTVLLGLVVLFVVLLIAVAIIGATSYSGPTEPYSTYS